VNDTQVIRDNTSKTEVRSKTIALMRLALAVFALLFFTLHISSASPVAGGYIFLLALYCTYAALHCVYPDSMLKILPSAWLHWIDLACYALIVYFSGGLVSPLFSFFFFAILVASFRYGFREGFNVTVACVLLSLLIYFFPLTPVAQSTLYPALMYKATLLILGYFIASWGGLVVQQKRQLKLLSEVNCMPDPRLSAEQLMGNSLESIREFYAADACIAVMKMPEGSYVIFKVANDHEKPMLLGQQLDEGIAAHLLAIPPQWSICYANDTEWYVPSLPTYKPRAESSNTKTNFGEAISQLLEVDAFASTPLRLHGHDIGRIYLTNCKEPLDFADMSFLQQLVNQITPRIDNIHLLDKIAAAATSAMRQKISIDLHDSTIQPYIGLKIGLQALRRKIPDGEAIAAEVDDLVNMTTESISELRQYVGGLKERLDEPLLPAILELAKKYQHRHGIEVTVNANHELKVSERLATEIYQLVCEGLSNIHRHTTAKQAAINLYYQQDQIVIEVINQADSTQDFTHFKPRSMTERVTHLGGTVSVNHHAGDKTVAAKTIVTAEIPLQLKDRRYAALA
jgi:signal transduction histidine kinase